MANGNFGGGNGTSTSPYLVEDASDVNAVRGKLTSHFLQTKNIDMSAYQNFAPIASGGSSFSGVYDGFGYFISNLKINNSTGGGCGLFGNTLGAMLQNIHLKNVDVKCSSTSASNTGSLVGFMYSGHVFSCSSSGLVSSIQSGTGGLFGRCAGGEIVGSSTSCDVSGTSDTGGFVGASADCKYKNCYSSGVVIGFDDVGGFVGETGSATVYENCYSSGSVSAGSYGGGFAGFVSAGTFSGCYSLAPFVRRLAPSTSGVFGIFSSNVSVPLTNFALKTTEFRGV